LCSNMYRNQRFGGNDGYMGGNWGGGWQGGVEWGRKGKRGPAFDMGGPMFDGQYFEGPPPKMMRMEMGGGRRFGGKRWGGAKKKTDAMKMADAIIEKHKAGTADAAGDAGESTKTEVKRKPKQEKNRRNPYFCIFCKTETKDKQNHLTHVKTPEHQKAIRKREIHLLDMMTNAYELSQRDVYNARMTGRRIRFCSACCLQFSGDGERHKRMNSHRSMEFNIRVRCNDCDSYQPTRLQHEKHLISLQHIRNQMYRMIEDGKTDYDNLDCPEEFDESVDVGNHYVVDIRAIFCKVCDKIVPTREQNALAHSKTEEHFNNYKKFAEVEKVEREKRKAEEEERKRLEAEKEAEEKNEADVKKEDETNDKEIDENEEEDEAAEEAATEEAACEEEAATEEAACEEAAATEEAACEEEGNTEQAAAEEKEGSPKRGRATRRSTRK